MKNLIQFITLMIKGAIIGIANVIPGVSGGTLAVTLGIYAPLVETIGNLPQHLKNKKNLGKDAAFLVPILIGIVIAILVFTKIIAATLVKQPVNCQLFFVGLIVGSIPLLLKLGEFNRANFITMLAFLLGAGLMLFFFYFDTKTQGGFSGTQTISNVQLTNPMYLLWLGLCGMLAATAMVIPGISGSLLLVMMGAYSPILQMVSRISSRTGELSFLYTSLGLSIFTVGMILGILLSTRLINWLIKHHKTNTMAFILGLVICSILPIWPAGISTDMHGLLIHGGVILSGAVIAYTLGR